MQENRINIWVGLFQILMIFGYFSTDFDVHRNWLRITANKTVDYWYYDQFSEWTLDYPPFFAYFQYLLSLLAYFICPSILNDDNKIDHSKECILFQRISVIVTQVFIYRKAIKMLINEMNLGKKQRIQLYFLIYANFGYLYADNVHFQYNSMLQGIQLISVYFMIRKQYICSAAMFAILLNFKHIYLYIAPIYFLFLLKVYCIDTQNRLKEVIKRIIQLGVVVIIVFCLSFYPFMNKQQLIQIASRLFPIKRGLMHSLWAGNGYAIYCVIDKGLQVFMNRIFGMNIKSSEFFNGVVGEKSFVVLPDVGVCGCLGMIVSVSMIVYVSMFRKMNGKKGFQGNFIKLCADQNLIFFYFGYHVHEKAILISLALYQIYSFMKNVSDKEKLNIFFMVLNGHVQLLLLIPSYKEYFIGNILLLIYSIFYYLNMNNTNEIKLSFIQKIQIIVIIFNQLFILFIFPLYFKNKFQFLDILLNQTTSSIFILYFLMVQIKDYLQQILNRRQIKQE